MAIYSTEFRESIVKKMMPPNAQSIASISRETGICTPTLYAWRNQSRKEGSVVPADPSNPENWGGADKLAVIIETASLNAAELSEYCRRRGLFVEQIQRWKEGAISGNESSSRLSAAERAEIKQSRQRNRLLEKELARKEKALAEAAALLVLKKKCMPCGGARERMIPPDQKERVIFYIDEAVKAGARETAACEVAMISQKTLGRWRKALADGQSLEDMRKSAAACRVSRNRLSEQEVAAILEVCNQPEYCSLPPSQIVPQLADQAQYLASESTFYRILRAADQQHHRGRAQRKQVVPAPRSWCASGPLQTWSWDITYLASAVRGQFYRLYLVLDVYSRAIMGWEVHAEESAEHASELIQKACLKHGIHQPGLVLHSDNGSPMKGSTMLSTLQRLGVVPSFSRPSVSNDNPYSESLFRTLKYAPAYPTKAFESIDAARQWVQAFVLWYNESHRHSALKFVTPMQRHRGEDVTILADRKSVYEAAKVRRPERWSGETRNWNPATEVWLNPSKAKAEMAAKASTKAA